MKERFIILETVKFGAMNDHKRTFQLQCKNFIILLFLAIQVVPTKQRPRAELKVLQISPNSSFVALKQPLKLNVTLTFNGTDKRYHFLAYVHIRWSFRRFSSTSFQGLASAFLFFWSRAYTNSYDPRAYIVNDSTLVLVNTSLDDSGTYRCHVWSWHHYINQYLYFNVTFEDEPKAEITCSKNSKLIEGENFSCWCHALGVNMVPTASWVKGGHILGNASSPGTELSLHNVSKDAAGTYVCRAQLYSLVDERTTVIIVHYRPRISFFLERRTFENNLLQLTCVADGFPEPSYIFRTSNGTELAQINNGVVIISNYSSTLNESYACIAKNNLGEDERRLKVEFDSRSPEFATKVKKLQSGIEWQIPLVSTIVGVLVGVGIGLVCGFQCIRRRNVIPTQLRTQNTACSTIYSEPSTTSQQGNLPIAGKPVSSNNAVPLRDYSSSDYQELNAVRENKENTYQRLKLTTRMKQAAFHQR